MNDSFHGSNSIITACAPGVCQTHLRLPDGGWGLSPVGMTEFTPWVHSPEPEASPGCAQQLFTMSLWSGYFYEPCSTDVENWRFGKWVNQPKVLQTKPEAVSVWLLNFPERSVDGWDSGRTGFGILKKLEINTHTHMHITYTCIYTNMSMHTDK